MHPTQQKLLNIAQNHNLSNLKLREIGGLIGLEHPQLIKHHLNQLIEKGLFNKNYTLLSTNKSGKINTVFIPVYGSANCGQPTLLAEENLESYLTISPQILNSTNITQLFALKAKGDSMNNSNIPIDNGDYVVVDRNKTNPTNGDIVVSIINGAANIKKYYFDLKNNLIYLLSESTNDYPPIIIDGSEEFMINGTVINVIKSPII